MKRLKQNVFLGLCLGICFGCNPMGSEKFKVEFKNPAAFKDLNTAVSNVSVVNDQLIISGATLGSIKTVTLKNESQEEVFNVESATENQIIANSSRAISIIAGSVFNLILSDAYGSATYQVTFSVSDGAISTAKISDGAVTSAKLDSMGASAGQYLKYNGVNWVASSLIDGQNYLGAWNVATNTPDLSMPSASAGDYYVVSNAGTFGGVAYGVGDWIISDGYNWQKLPYSKTSVSSFQGRKGIVTLQPADYVSLKDGVTGKITGSSLNDLANIDLTTAVPVAGNVLKYDGTKWIAGADNAGIAAGSIADADISGTADIAQSKISGLSASLTAKQNTSSLAADVRAIPLTGLTSTAGTVAATDSILDAFGKLLNAQSDYVSKSSGATITTGTIAVGGTGMITIPTASGTTLTEAANVTYVSNAIAANGVWAKDGTTINYTAGNVGIGTASPGALLDVNGNTYVRGTFYANSIGNLTGGATPLMVGNLGYGYIALRVDTKNVGVGVQNPASRLEVQGLTNDNTASVFNATDLAGNSKFFIRNDGNVGIGTTAPEQKLSLDNDGGILAKGTFGSGATLTTAGAGTRLIWYPRKAAFRAGSVTGTQWNDVSIGTNSFATGTATASGSYSHAFGSGTASGTSAIVMGSSCFAAGTSAVAMGYNTFANGNHSTAMGYNAQANAWYSTATGRDTVASGSLSFVAGNGTTAAANAQATFGQYNQTIGGEDPSNWVLTNPLFVVGNGTSTLARSNALVILKNGNMGIGTNTASEKLEVNGNVKATAFLYSSDQRLKKNIEPISDALGKINKLGGYFYEWKSSSKKDIGVIAQEVENVFPDLVATDSKGMKSVKYGNLIAPIIEAIKEFYAKFISDSEEKERRLASLEEGADTKDAEILELKAQNAELNRRTKELEKAICQILPDSSVCIRN